MEKGIESLHQLFLEAKQNISTDSRNISKGCLFFALKGENFDGNSFADEALKKGAAFVIADDRALSKNEKIIVVDNVLSTLQALANYHRRNLSNTKFIALTGSNGKTTTKELILMVLSQKFKTVATKGNLNNHIGVPLTILSVKSDCEFAVIEMGANHQKEIELLCSITEPGYGLITNVGKAHLEGFGGFEGVKKGKGELYQYLQKNNGIIFINSTNKHLTDLCGSYNNVIKYGNNETDFCSVELIVGRAFVSVEWKTGNKVLDINSNITGDYNFENIMTAICVGSYFGVADEKIKNGIECYFPSNQRSQVIKKGSNTLVLDYYNANPTSMEAALLNFYKNYEGRKIVLLGEMLELGSESEAEHKKIISLLKSLHFSCIVLTGKNFHGMEKEISASYFENSAEAKEWIAKQKISDSSVLIKGSRGSKMEITLEGFS